MKIYILLFAVLIFGLTINAQEKVNWISLNEALELQKEKPKKIIMDVYTNWCGPCKMLDKNTFQNKDVATYINQHYYAVKFNAEGNSIIDYKDQKFENPNYDPVKKNRRNSSHQFSMSMRINAFPTIVFFDEKGDFITPIKGYQTPQQIELYLKMFDKNEHKEINSQERFNEYYKAFKPEFKS